MNRPNKLNAQKSEVDGIIFHSKAEGRRYWELKMLQRAGEISDLQIQVKFELAPAFIFDGKKEQPIYYFVDFGYIENGIKVYEESKGFKTDVYKIKRKLFLRIIAAMGNAVIFRETGS